MTSCIPYRIRLLAYIHVTLSLLLAPLKSLNMTAAGVTISARRQLTDPSFSSIIIIFTLALCKATLFKYSVAWQRVKEVTNRPSTTPHLLPIRLLFLFLLAFLNFFLIFFILLFLSSLFLRPYEDPSFEAPLIQVSFSA